MLISGGCLNAYTSGIVGTALEDGSVSKFVSELRQDYSERMTAAYEILVENLPKTCQINLPRVSLRVRFMASSRIL